jgi:predicted ATP-binding protein involved in virulence
MLRLRGLEELRRNYREYRNWEYPELSKRSNLMLTDTSLVTDEEMIQKIINLDYAAYRRNQPAIRTIIEKVASIASEITVGFPITFLGVEEDEEGLFPQFNTPNGDLPLNVLSQGTQSIIQCLAHLLFGYAEYYDFSQDFEKMPGILVIDEIDAHLHPSWQRRMIPALTNYFSNLQIFCSTHSPLMLAGLKAGQVQLLRRDDAEGRMTVSTNESDISGWTADEILRNFMGLPNPTDLDTAMHVIRLQELRRKEELSHEEAEELENLRHTVNQELVSGPIAARLEMQDILRRASSESPETSEPPSSETKEEGPSDALG